MKALMIAAPNSNSGKTAFTVSLLSVLKEAGFDLSAFKTGPDRTDRLILEAVLQKSAGNLDIFMMGMQGIGHALSLLQAEYCLIEGVMGCFDGIGNSPRNSSFEIAQNLNINILLVYTPKGEMFSMIPKLKGMLDYAGGSIKGIVLNKMSADLYPAYKKNDKAKSKPPRFRFLPDMPELRIENGGLSLKTNGVFAKSGCLHTVTVCAAVTLNIKKIVSLFKPVKTQKLIPIQKKETVVGIAMDDALNRYYSETLFLFKTYASVRFFSPLNDKALPVCGLLYLGSGDIKSYAKQLAADTRMTAAIRDFAEKGGVILTEGEAVNYLFERFDGYEMCGIFKGCTQSTQKLHNFGYKVMKTKKDTILGKKGGIFYAAEYHKSKPLQGNGSAFSVHKLSGGKPFTCGFVYKNTLGFFQNIHFIACLNSFSFLLEYAGKNRIA